MTEQLTDEERKWLSTSGQWPPLKTTKKALRIIDAQSADRAALVAQLERLQASDLGIMCKAHDNASNQRDELLYTKVPALVAQLEAANEEVKNLISHGTNLLAENERHKAHVAELTQQLQKERDRRVEHRQMNQSLNEQVQRLVAQVAELTRERDEARRKLAAHLDCSVRKLESEVTRLTAELEACQAANLESCQEVVRLQEALAAAERNHASTHRAWDDEIASRKAAEARVRDLEALEFEWRSQLKRAESECAALRAEVADSRKFWTESKALEINARLEAESRLATANALLERCQKAVSPVSLLGRDLDAHIAAHSSTAPARDEAEQWVLSELSEVTLHKALVRTTRLLERWYIQRYIPGKGGSRADLVAETRAELARREDSRG